MEMINVNERLVVIKRKNMSDMHIRCDSALKGNGGNVTSGFTYLLKARIGTKSSAAYIHSIVNVTLIPLNVTQGHNGTKGYKATYLDGKNTTRTRYNLTLKEKDPNGTCFVILLEKNNREAGCELLVPASKRITDIPQICEKYYTNNCTGNSTQIYERDCRYDKLDTNVVGC
ncbi:hypothetical protein V5799_030285 [Amblyomma americanum]|uniref:Salivary lipocalin n=1 Tax=Amblyomma americanum TaxID=6943 RepID=A0AAQ4EP73_AMBAM